ncbi:hypothetical protein [Streptomyces sp. NPDC002785]|uniref:hypothetical protein n=1 Tax=Streptomyces sp. NPDC002785 TaxID=3154543 RepID=UPI003320A620
MEALSYYPHLLAWDLSRLPAKKAVTPVVLLDTFEDTADRHRDLERLLQRLVWLMPNVFFILAGRSRLQWADPGLHVAHHMAGLPLPGPTTTQWIDSPDAVRARWQHLVHTRRTRTGR